MMKGNDDTFTLKLAFNCSDGKIYVFVHLVFVNYAYQSKHFVENS